MPFVTADDGVALHYTARGSGRPIVLVHAWTLSGRLFDAAADRLSVDHHVVLLDQRSHGRSGREARNLTMEQLGRDIDTLLTTLDLHDVVLGGWSMGMTATYNYVNQFGLGRLAGLISIDMTPRILTDEGWPHCTYGDLSAESSLAFQDRVVHEGLVQLGPEIVTACLAEGSTPDPALADLMAAESGSVPPLHALSLWVSMSNQDWRELLPTLDIPFLITQGSKSICYPTPVWAYLEERLPQATVPMFEQSGHTLPAEEPDRFATVVHHFMGTLE